VRSTGTRVAVNLRPMRVAPCRVAGRNTDSPKRFQKGLTMSTGTLFAVEAQTGLNFPKTLVEEFKPSKLSDFVGLDKNRKILAKFIAKPFPVAMLFNGASGTGKTAMAYAVANELNATVWHVGSQDCKVDRLIEISGHCNYVPKAGLRGFHVVIVDEADAMSDASQKYLLSKLDGTEPCPSTVWIFTCNSPDGLEPRFLSRNSIKLEFTSYGSGEAIADLLARVWSLKAPNAEAPNFKRLASGNVRESLAKLEIELLSI
jgi:replication-associated recombination protein RarA